jgi:hypothetical protein
LPLGKVPLLVKMIPQCARWRPRYAGFQQAFSEKVRKHGDYIKKGWVNPNEGYIVCALMPGLETEWVEVEFDETTSRIGEFQ